MGKDSAISWTTNTYNIVWGCTRVSQGCRNCYAETLAKRFGYDVWGVDKPRRTFGEKHWNEPKRWNRIAREANERHRTFACSMADAFEDHPTTIAELAKLWPLIRETPNLDWLVLTKRAERIALSLPDDWGTGYPNVWLGTSVEHMETAYRAEVLRTIPAVSRFISYEPALGSIANLDLSGIDWLICGGESGPGHRPMDEDWAREARNACARQNVAFFFKQHSGPRSGMEPTLDGVVHQAFPVPRVPQFV